MTAEELSARIGPTTGACEALGVARATLYRRRRPPVRPQARPTSHRALRAHERQLVLDALHSPRFIDKAPAQVWATLLDEGTYYCSVRTMYRILHDSAEVRERRDLLRHPSYQKPELLATAPNEVWSWDIDHRHLQPLRHRLDDRSVREWGPGPASHRPKLCQATHHTGSAHPARRPRRLDALEISRLAVG